MALVSVQTMLADHPALRACLENRGFERTSPSEYSNGRATVRFEGVKVVATPLDGSKAWRTDLGSVPPEAAAGMLDAILANPPFLSTSAREAIVEQAHRAKIALDRMIDVVRELPGTSGARELRCFLLSLFNQHHDINLWRLRNALDSQRNSWVTEVYTAWTQGRVPEEALRRALVDAGEIEPTGDIISRARGAEFVGLDLAALRRDLHEVLD
ncbi:MAG: hypothetical protein AB7O66_01935 [Limisphaerales bacterium]